VSELEYCEGEMLRFGQLMTLALVFGVAEPATAATLRDDTIRMVGINRGKIIIDTTILIKDGPDLLGSGNTVYDFDTGPAGDEFELSMSPPALYGGVLSGVGASQITLSGLDFSGGESLRDWSFLQVPSDISISAELLGPSSLRFSWTEGRFEGGTFLRGRFLTRMEAPGPIPNPIPLPAGSLLLMTVMGLVSGLVFKRQKSVGKKNS
jgi:hypothetical protein